MKQFHPLILIGTRPEAIKLAPLVKACQSAKDFSPEVCLTGQHDSLLKQATDYFELPIDDNLRLMRENDSLAKLTSRAIDLIDQKVKQSQPDCLIVQGDTTSVFAGSLVAFYNKVPLVHVEAGLRRHDLEHPYPEELNRRITSIVTSVHCAPTELAAQNLREEGIPKEKIELTGNTIVDALHFVLKKKSNQPVSQGLETLINQPYVLVTCHRRENFGEPLKRIMDGLTKLCEAHSKIQFIYLLHPNPSVQETAKKELGNTNNLHLIQPVSYPESVRLIDQAMFVISDSGGIQEEAPSLGKKILILREKTERPETISAGYGILIGSNASELINRGNEWIEKYQAETLYPRGQILISPFGDGKASEKILKAIRNRLF